ncbi:MAG TPA: extracellular solute-binding protein [candidate division Zixibacteria bacterium]|nr:extracellular solute-binding protein [candidate division Zixibacteria bacterium]
MVVLLLAGGQPITQAAAPRQLVEAAAKEGEVVFYASMNLGEANALISRFQERYPAVKVRLNRTGSEKLLTKVLAEAAAGKSFADVIQTVEFSMYLFKRRGVLARYVPPEDSLYPREFKDSGYWTTVYYHPYVAAYNTRLVSPLALPKSYDDLLDPKWKGKMMMEGTKAEWFAGMLQILGRERGLAYMRALAKQEPTQRVGHELLAQLVAAGESWLDINIPSSSVDRLRQKGAPIDWTALGPAPAIMVGTGLSARAPHPSAARLYLDFVLSQEGQKIIQGFGRLVARSDLARGQTALVRGIQMVPVDPALAERMEEYSKQLREIFSR